MVLPVAPAARTVTAVDQVAAATAAATATATATAAATVIQAAMQVVTLDVCAATGAMATSATATSAMLQWTATQSSRPDMTGNGAGMAGATATGVTARTTRPFVLIQWIQEQAQAAVTIGTVSR